jgi:hypothetical protein
VGAGSNERAYRTVIVAVGVALVVLFAGACTILAVGNPVPTELWAAASALSGALVGLLVPPSQSTTAHHARTIVALATQNAATAKAQTAAEEAGAANPGAGADAAQAALGEVQAIDPFVTALASVGKASESALTALANGVTSRHQATLAAANEALATAKSAAPPGEDTEAVKAAEIRVNVLDAAAKASEQETGAAVTAGLTVAGSAGKQGLQAWASENTKTIVALAVFVVTLLVGVLLATQLSGNTAANATEHDIALLGVVNTLIALASAAGGAALGTQAPPATGTPAGPPKPDQAPQA